MTQLRKWADEPCILSDWNPSSYGYGFKSMGGRYAHREAWESVRGPIPAGMVINHLCRVRLCINVNHLEVVTPGDNARYSSLKEYCKRGHHKGIGIRCKKCKSITARERRAIYGRRSRGAEYPDLRFKTDQVG